MYIILRVLNPQTFDAVSKVYGLSSFSSLFFSDKWLFLIYQQKWKFLVKVENINPYTTHTQSNRTMKSGIL